MVQILVRSPSVTTPDNFSVHVGLEQSIADLKQSIEASHHASPLAQGMRIIWKGRVLEDTDLVRSIYADEEASEAQTVHFVLNSPVSIASASRRLFNRSDMASPPPPLSIDRQERSSHAESSKKPSMPQPSVVPLGNQFQYVLVDGIPYLMVLKPVGAIQSGAYSAQQQQQQQQLSAALVGENSDEMQTIERLNAHLEMRNRMLQELEETSVRLERLMALNRARGRGQRGGVRARQAANNDADNADNGHPLADVLRNLNFSAIWSVGWMLLRMLLLVVVFAHDASLDRILMLTVVVCCFFALRSPWVQQHLMWLNQHNNYIDAQTHGDDADNRGHRQFTAWERSKALAIGLFTSLVPSEPFQPPAVEE
ncbi:hypothetical protein H4R27_003508 [Coemansia aciculifera]|nr:hypothetical protein H4R27_003508 [Coemansia aciculifera]